MINKVTYRIIARKEKKTADQTMPICLQAFVNTERVVIPLSMKVPVKYWDAKQRCIKNSCAESLYWNADISTVKINVAAIITEANARKVKLTRETFKAKITNAISNADFIAYAENELEKREDLERSTYNQHKSSFKKLKAFRSKILFSEIDEGLLLDYERWLYGKGNNVNTVYGALKNLKTYVNLAILRGFEIKNPFKTTKFKKGQSRKTFLTVPELHTLLNKYDNHEVSKELRESLLVFLTGCFTSLRISDLKNYEPHWLIGKELSFMPLKTSGIQKRISFELSKIALRLSHDLFLLKSKKKLKSEQKINSDLKLIAALCSINKPITTHVARHTFATIYLTLKGTERGTVEVLQQILGHYDITTTMIYVHLLDERKNEQMRNFDNEFK